jgi:hypothetical protein
VLIQIYKNAIVHVVINKVINKVINDTVKFVEPSIIPVDDVTDTILPLDDVDRCVPVEEISVAVEDECNTGIGSVVDDSYIVAVAIEDNSGNDCAVDDD